MPVVSPDLPAKLSAMDAMHEPATSSESGEKGDATRKRLEYFVANVMDQKWRFVPGDDMEADSPDALVKSKATRIEKGCHTATRSERRSRPSENIETAGRQPRIRISNVRRARPGSCSDPAKKPRLATENNKRVHSPVDRRMDPPVEVSAGPIFSPPIKEFGR